MLNRRAAAALLVAALVAAAAGGGRAAKPAESPAPRDNDRWRACFDKEVAEMKRVDSRRQASGVFGSRDLGSRWQGGGRADRQQRGRPKL